MCLLSAYAGLKQPKPKLSSDRGYGFYGLGQAYWLPPMGNEPSCGFWTFTGWHIELNVDFGRNSGFWPDRQKLLFHPMFVGQISNFFRVILSTHEVIERAFKNFWSLWKILIFGPEKSKRGFPYKSWTIPNLTSFKSWGENLIKN